MTNTDARNRQSAGQPTGGQFAHEAKGTETGVDLGVVSAAHDHPVTPFGIAAMSRDLDTAIRNDDQQIAEHLTQRLAEMEHRVNYYENEAAHRGMHTGEPQPGSDFEDDEDRAARLAQQWDVRGVSKIGDPVSDGKWGFHTPHDVTLIMDDPDTGDERSETFEYHMGSAHGSTPPTCANVLNNIALDAASVDNAGGDYDVWASEIGIPDDEPEAYEQGRRDFEKVKDNAERMENLLGAERFEQLKWGEQ